MTRRDCLLLLASSPLLAAETDMPRRIGRLISEYEGQGIHRTGTETDKASADWLMGIGLQAGLKPVRESFSLNRVDVIESHVTRGGRRIEGIPLFDGAFTDAAGITGKIGPLGSDAPIGLMSLPPNAAGAGAIGEARRQNKHRAIVAITRGGKPGLCPSNADSFLHPFGAACRADRRTSQRGWRSNRDSTRATNPGYRIQRGRDDPGNRSRTAAPDRHDPAKRLVDLRKRARRRHCLLG